MNEQFEEVQGTLLLDGNPDTESFSVFPRWDGTTTCSVIEALIDGAESDDSGCQGVVVTPGNGASCEIVNTLFYEGIPTLSRASLIMLTSLMLGLGLVATRRLTG